MRKPKYLYHWTHRRNLACIMRQGLLASKARGKLNAVWLCESSRLGWALSHVAMGHDWSADELVCLRISTRRLKITRSGFKGAYTVRGDVPHWYIDGYIRSLLDAFVDV